ncbi:MAG: diaminopimelate epimerase [Solirubrobacterales bacterium]
MRFEKWQALGNDYVILAAEDLRVELTPGLVTRICRPHTGIGSDGILVLARCDDPEIVAELRIFNPDGSEAELSGNGAREAVLYLRDREWTDQDRFTVMTKAGPIHPTITGPESATIGIGTASLTSADFPSGGTNGTGTLTAGGRSFAFQHVSIGNPQCVIEAGHEVEDLDLAAIGPDVERNALFPNRTNASFISIDGSTVRARIFERGVGETLSSGTGASGAAVAAFLKGATSPITVVLDGGELEVEISDRLDVKLTGTARRVFTGELSSDLVGALDGD